MDENTTIKKPTGFAAMSKERQVEIARMGGAAARNSGRARRWTSEEARAASLKSHAIKRAKLQAGAVAG